MQVLLSQIDDGLWTLLLTALADCRRVRSLKPLRGADLGLQNRLNRYHRQTHTPVGELLLDRLQELPFRRETLPLLILELIAVVADSAESVSLESAPDDGSIYRDALLGRRTLAFLGNESIGFNTIEDVTSLHASFSASLVVLTDEDAWQAVARFYGMGTASNSVVVCQRCDAGI